jgi:uncharacterized OB-fold protein
MMLEPHPIDVPGPSPSALTQPFWDGCSRHELLFQRCEDCGAAVFQPSTVCRNCSSRKLLWTPSTGRGVVYSWSTVWRPPTPAFKVPFVVAIVELEEGYQMVANIIGCTASALRTGLPVAVEFHPIGDGRVLPYFAPRPAGKQPQTTSLSTGQDRT